MKTVYLTSGPMGAGKSTYVKTVLAMLPKVPLISRDKIREDLYGGVWIDGSCDSGSAIDIMYVQLRSVLRHMMVLISYMRYTQRRDNSRSSASFKFL